MAFINVAEWTPDNVAQWLKGLEDCILPYVNFFLNNQINGCRLLLLSPNDLVKLNVTKIGHQEIILDGVDLLKHLHYNFNSETLQSLVLRLGLKSRKLYNDLKQEQEELQITNSTATTGSQSSLDKSAITKNGTLKHKNNSSSHKNLAKNQDQSNVQSTNQRNKVSTKTLFAVCDILNLAKTFISWIDRYPFDEKREVYAPIRKTILKLSIELASTAQRDQFVDRPNDIILTNCLTFANLCDRIVQNLSDSLSKQPASLDVALIKKRSNEELGMHIHSSYSGIHIISGIKVSSVTNNCGRIDEGDEIVQVNYRTVVGWQLRKLVDIMKEYQTELILTLKKRPKYNALVNRVNMNKSFKLPLRENSLNQIGLPPMNGSMTLKPIKPRKPLPDEYSNEYSNIGAQNQLLDAQMLNGSISKGKAAIRRRATISGSTSSLNKVGAFRVDDILIKNHQDFTKIQKEPKPIVQEKQSDNSQSSASVPFAKVQPLQQSEEVIIKQTVPKQVTNNLSTFSVSSTSNGKTVATIKSTASNENNIGVVLPNTSRTSEQLKLSTFQAENNTSSSSTNQQNSPNSLVDSTTTESNSPPSLPPNKPPLRQRNTNNLNNSVNNSSNNSQPPPPLPAGEKPAIPQRPTPAKSTLNQPQQQQPATIQLNRFVSLKQIEEENSLFFKQNPTSPLCQLINNTNSSTNNNNPVDKQNKEFNNLLGGWLYTKREHFNTLLNANAKWSAKYVQLSTNYQLYAFRNEHATKADLVINLAAFKVSPACECKSKENVFKAFNKHVIFLFSSESQAQMRQWVENLRQLVANCASTKPELMRLSTSPDVACYSETEDEEDVIDDEMMLQNFANELVETNKREQEKEETIESKIDLIETEVVDKKTNDTEFNNESNEDEQIKPIKIADLDCTPTSTPNSTLTKSEQKVSALNENDDEEEKHNRRMMRLLTRRRQRYTSTAESCRDSSPSSTSSASSSANTSSSASAGQAMLNRFEEIKQLKERLQKQAQEKLEQRRLAIASGKRMYERSASCMDASTVANLHNRLAAGQLTANTTNNTPVKSGLIRNKSGSQQSLLSPTSNEVFDLSPDKKRDQLPAKPFYMTNKNKVLPSIPPLPPRPPKPVSISITNTTNTVTTSSSSSTVSKSDDKLSDKQQQQINTDELNKRSHQQPLPQPRTSKNGLSATVDEQQQLADNINKENIDSSNSILKSTLQSDQKLTIANHKDNEYISGIIDELYNFSEQSKPVIPKTIIPQSNQPTSELLTSAPIKKMDNNTAFNQPNVEISENNSMLNYQPNFRNNQMNACQQLNEQHLHQLQSMLNNQNMIELPELHGEDLDDLSDFDDEDETDEEFSDGEEEYEMNEDYNKMYNGGVQNLNNFVQNTNENNLFGLGGASSSTVNQMNDQLVHNNNSSNNGVGFLTAPGPNFLNSAPGLALNQQHQSSGLLNNNHHHNDNHLRNDLGSSSNSNNYPTSSSTNSFNISPYSSISQHNNAQHMNEHLPIQMDGAFNSQVNQLNNQFTQLCNLNATDEQLSDSSSGVSSNFSLIEKQSLEYLKAYFPDQDIDSLPEEDKQKFVQQFQIEFARQLALQMQLQQQYSLQQLQEQALIAQQRQNQHQQLLQNFQQQQNQNQALGTNHMQQLMALASNTNSPFSDLSSGSGGHQLMNHHHHELDQLDDEDELESDLSSDFDEEDEDSENDLEFEQDEGLDKRLDQKKIGRKLSSLFGSPKMLKKFKNKSLKHQKDKRNTNGHNTGDTTDAKTNSTGDASSVWISMGDKMLDEEHNLVDQPKSPSTKKDTDEKDGSLNKSFEKDLKNKKTSSSENTSLNSSQSSFVVQLTKGDVNKENSNSKNNNNSSSKTSTSLASKWFGRKSDSGQNNDKKKNPSKTAPQITQVIYKRKPNLPELPEKPSLPNKENNKNDTNSKMLRQTVSIPDDEDTDDDPIYTEINETQLVLEEMRRSLNQHSTERKIIEMILQQPTNSLQDNKLNSTCDQMKVK